MLQVTCSEQRRGTILEESLTCSPHGHRTGGLEPETERPENIAATVWNQRDDAIPHLIKEQEGNFFIFKNNR